MGKVKPSTVVCAICAVIAPILMAIDHKNPLWLLSWVVFLPGYAAIILDELGYGSDEKK